MCNIALPLVSKNRTITASDAQSHSYSSPEKRPDYSGEPKHAEAPGGDGMREADLGAALLGFNGEAETYCSGINDTVARAYALGYARMIEDRARGLTPDLPKLPRGLFEPNRKWIRATLEEMSKRHFSAE
jgi:hypothetical protein